MGFESMYNSWLEHHTNARRGERRRRLVEGHAHAERAFAEKVWYPGFGHFHNLHPEYEIIDYLDGIRFVDYAWMEYPVRFIIEIDSYGSHQANISRRDFADSRMRQNSLVIDRWEVIRFSYDTVKDNPRLCQQVLQQYMGSRLGRNESTSIDDIVEKEVVRLLVRLRRPIQPADVCSYMRVMDEKARIILRSMTQKNILLPAGSGQSRIRAYKLNLDSPYLRNIQL
ncbi:DNA-binding response regulator [Paenibacillus sp. GCM10023252]|uniref:DNA-binding response regulator n=1 Tax=Paenibacillus sp. GCM10023252 TaxID=3252649 RepID=UPI0036213E1A